MEALPEADGGEGGCVDDHGDAEGVDEEVAEDRSGRALAGAGEASVREGKNEIDGEHRHDWPEELADEAALMAANDLGAGERGRKKKFEFAVARGRKSG